MGGFDDVVYRGQHDVLDLQKPPFDGAARLTRRNRLVELNLLQLAAVHRRDVQIAVELEVADALEALLQVRLDARRVLCLRQDFQHFVVRQEKEPEASKSNLKAINDRVWCRIQNFVHQNWWQNINRVAQTYGQNAIYRQQCELFVPKFPLFIRGSSCYDSEIIFEEFTSVFFKIMTSLIFYAIFSFARGQIKRNL